MGVKGNERHEINSVQWTQTRTVAVIPEEAEEVQHVTFGVFGVFGNAGQDRKALQWAIKQAQKITRTQLFSMQIIYNSMVCRWASSVIKDHTHPAHDVIHLLMSGRKYQSMGARTSRLWDSLYPQTIRLTNNSFPLPPGTLHAIQFHDLNLLSYGALCQKINCKIIIRKRSLPGPCSTPSWLLKKFVRTIEWTL